MSKKTSIKNAVKADYFVCKRCNLNSRLVEEFIGCARGSCEAVKIGEVIKTTEYIFDEAEDIKHENRVKCPACYTENVFESDDVRSDNQGDFIICGKCEGFIEVDLEAEN